MNKQIELQYLIGKKITAVKDTNAVVRLWLDNEVEIVIWAENPFACEKDKTLRPLGFRYEKKGQDFDVTGAVVFGEPETEPPETVEISGKGPMLNVKKTMRIRRSSVAGQWEPVDNKDSSIFRHFTPDGEIRMSGMALDAFTEVAELHGYSVQLV